jgi:DNA processing protein
MSDPARLVLSSTGMHPDRVRQLLAEFGAERAVAELASGRLGASSRVRAAAAGDATRLSGQLAKIGVDAVLRGSPTYPATLDRLPDAPDVLFVRGVIPRVPAVAIVGTRRCTGYGRGLARAMGAAVAAAGWVTVSGLARGIDVEAHKGTLDGGGRGIAVLGSGPDVWYPREHRAIGLALAAAGAIITEYPPGTPPEPWRFPVRNRIISGLAEAVLVVEAATRGGALITARTALDQGVPVFVVPGDIDRSASEGCNLLIRDGAHPVLGAADLIEELSLVMGRPPSQPVAAAGTPLLEALGDTGATADAVASSLGLAIGTVLGDLARLEASGTVRREGDRYLWSRRLGVADSR